ncbi:unnamed protein product, partial [marine sediment metagenome]
KDFGGSRYAFFRCIMGISEWENHYPHIYWGL